MKDLEAWRWIVAVGLAAVAATMPTQCHMEKSNGWRVDIERRSNETEWIRELVQDAKERRREVDRMLRDGRGR